MKKPVVNPAGPGDVIWVVEYLTELINTNFDAAVTQGSVDGGSSENSVADHVVGR